MCPRNCRGSVFEPLTVHKQRFDGLAGSKSGRASARPRAAYAARGHAQGCAAYGAKDACWPRRGEARQGRVIWVRIFGAPSRPPNPSSPQRTDIVTKLLRCFNASMRLAAQKLHSQTNPVVLDRLTFNGICLHSQCTRENHEGITLKAMPNANRPTSRAVSQDK